MLRPARFHSEFRPCLNDAMIENCGRSMAIHDQRCRRLYSYNALDGFRKQRSAKVCCRLLIKSAHLASSTKVSAPAAWRVVCVRLTLAIHGKLELCYGTQAAAQEDGLYHGQWPELGLSGRSPTARAAGPRPNSGIDADLKST